jgi:hypothetical protein
VKRLRKLLRAQMKIIYLLAMIHYIYLTPETNEGLFNLPVHFISQSAPNIPLKCQRLEDAPEMPQADLLKTATKIFNNRRKNKRPSKSGGIRPNP